MKFFENWVPHSIQWSLLSPITWKWPFDGCTARISSHFQTHPIVSLFLNISMPIPGKQLSVLGSNVRIAGPEDMGSASFSCVTKNGLVPNFWYTQVSPLIMVNHHLSYENTIWWSQELRKMVGAVEHKLKAFRNVPKSERSDWMQSLIFAK